MGDKLLPIIPLGTELFDAPLNDAGYNALLGGVFSDMTYRARNPENWDGSEAEIEHSIDVLLQWWEYLQRGRFVLPQRLKIARIAHVEALNVDGGDATNNNWEVCILNTIKYSEIVGLGLAGNQLTLPVGDFLLVLLPVRRKPQDFSVRLYNVTDGIVADSGASFRAWSDVEMSVRFPVFVPLSVTIAPKAFEMQVWQQANVPGTGMGQSVGYGTEETYSEIIVIERVTEDA